MMGWFQNRNDEPKAVDTRSEGGDGKLHPGQIPVNEGSHPKTSQEIARDQAKVCELSQALAAQRDEREARAAAINALDHDAKVQREQAAAVAAKAEQERQQRLLDEATAAQERCHSLAAFEKLNRIRRQEGDGPVEWATFTGEKS
jgi:hypothetical protein